MEENRSGPSVSLRIGEGTLNIKCNNRGKSRAWLMNHKAIVLAAVCAVVCAATAVFTYVHDKSKINNMKADMAKMQEENSRLSEENERLSQENKKLEKSCDISQDALHEIFRSEVDEHEGQGDSNNSMLFNANGEIESLDLRPQNDAEKKKEEQPSRNKNPEEEKKPTDKGGSPSESEEREGDEMMHCFVRIVQVIPANKEGWWNIAQSPRVY